MFIHKYEDFKNYNKNNEEAKVDCRVNLYGIPYSSDPDEPYRYPAYSEDPDYGHD